MVAAQEVHLSSVLVNSLALPAVLICERCWNLFLPTPLVLTTWVPWLLRRRICNQDIIGRVKQIICFAFHDSNLLLETCHEARQQSRIVTLFYLD
jgi:hypothetical protein